MEVMGEAIAKRDSDTNIHNYRVTLYAIRLAEALDYPANRMSALIAGAFLHDVGKIGIPDAILFDSEIVAVFVANAAQWYRDIYQQPSEAVEAILRQQVARTFSE